MREIQIMTIGIVLILLIPVGPLFVTDEAFAQDYITRYIELFGEDTYDRVSTPTTGESYTARYIDMFGEDMFEMKVTPLDSEAYISRYNELFLDQPTPTPTPPPTPAPSPRPTLPEVYRNSIFEPWFPLRDYR